MAGGRTTRGRRPRSLMPRRSALVVVALVLAAELAGFRVPAGSQLLARGRAATVLAPRPAEQELELLAARSDPAGMVRRHGSHLYLDGTAFDFVGINAPQAATDPSVSPGCGAEIDLAALLDRLPPRSVVRVGFGQDTTVNAGTGQRDWSGLDRVVRLAEQSPSHPRLAVSLTSQSGTCDAGHWRGRDWYAGGYRRPQWGRDGQPRIAYVDYLQQVVSRYAASPAIAYWEPVGEPEASDCAPGFDGSDCYGHLTCPPDATSVLRSFFDDVGAEIRGADPMHPIADGAIGGTQCGWGAGGAARILASPGLDIATFHDYGQDEVALPDELRQRINVAREAGKPVVVGEVGVSARNVPGCTSLATRARELAAKLAADRAAGVSGFVPWDYAERLDDRCDTRITPSDPSFALVVGGVGTAGPP